MDEKEALREAAIIISELLLSLANTDQTRKFYYIWERNALKWLSEQMPLTDGMLCNGWVFDRMKEFEAGDTTRRTM